MPDEPEDRLSRADIHALENRIVSLEVKIASLPTQRDLTRVAFLALLAGAALRSCRNRGAAPIAVTNLVPFAPEYRGIPSIRGLAAASTTAKMGLKLEPS